MNSNNPLDVLFKDIKRELWREDQAKKRAHSQGRVHVPPSQSTYANPQNWTPGKVIELVHATEGSLGVFQEYFHRLSPTARRLLPAAAGVSPVTQELVWGEFWLHPKFQAPHETETQAEIRAIQRRFQELMENYASGIWDEEEPDYDPEPKDDGLTWNTR